MDNINLQSFSTNSIGQHKEATPNYGSIGGSGLANLNNESLRSIQSNITKVYKTLGQEYSTISNSNLPNLQIKDSSSDSIYIEAELLLELLAKQTLSITMLSAQQKTSIFLYLFKYNKKIGRIIDLFVGIPLSGMELRYPDTVDNPIIKDYVKDFFQTMWSELNFKEKVVKTYRDKRLFGLGAMLISDDYHYSTYIKDRKTQKVRQESYLDFNNIKQSMDILAKDLIQKDDGLEDIESLTKKYKQDKNSIDLASKKAVIYRYFTNLQGEDLSKLSETEEWVDKYTGLRFLKNIDPYEALNRTKNADINFYQFTLKTDNKIKESFKSMEDDKLIQVANMLQNLGYSKSYLATFTASEESINIDTYPYSSTDCWVAVLENSSAYSDKDKAILNRVLHQAIDIEIVAKANRSKSNRAYKSITTYTTEATGDDFKTIEGLIHSANQVEGSSYIITNKNITTDEISMDARQVVDLDSISQKAEEDLIAGLGMTDSLVGGNDSYANSYLKLELLNNEFIGERQELARFIEEQIFKPIAIKKGLFIKDTWGKVIPVYPKVSFDRINLARNSEDFQLLLSMASEGKLPYTYILKALNFDVDEMKNLIEKEQTTVFNDTIREYVSTKVLENDKFASFIVKDKKHIAKILKEMNIEVSDEDLDMFVKTLEERVLTEDDVEDLIEKYEESHPDDEIGAFSINSQDMVDMIGGRIYLVNNIGATNIQSTEEELSFMFSSSREANKVQITNIEDKAYKVSISKDIEGQVKTIYEQTIKELSNFNKLFNNVTGLDLPIKFKVKKKQSLTNSSVSSKNKNKG